MNNIKSIFLIFLAVIMLATIIGFSFAVPVDTHAHPAFGFTPTPKPPDGGGGDDNDGHPPPSPPEETLTDYVLVQLDQCDLECAAEFGEVEQPQEIFYLPETGAVKDMLSDNLPSPIQKVVAISAPEIQVPVQLVHQGSGWIADETLSTQRSNRIMVPYPGKWEVFMTGQPRFITADAVNATGTNLAELQAQVADNTVSLGVVETNTAETQMVKCPIQCVGVPPPEEIFYLPETGTVINMSPIVALAITGLVLFVMGLFAWVVIKLGPAEQ